MNIEIVIITALNFLFYALIIRYLLRLEEIGCECAMTFKRKYILYFTSVNLILMLLSLTNVMDNFRKNKDLYGVFIMVYSMSSLLNIFYTIQYVNELKEMNCDCSESYYREMMYIFAIIDAIMVFLKLLIVISFTTNLMVMKTIKKKK
mgnify:CR=1 FL=1